MGAFQSDLVSGTDAGSAFVFVRSGTTWTEQAKLVASDAAANDAFGRAVALSGDTVVVGARLDDHAGGTNAGSAYVFVRNGTTWTEQAKLVASDASGSTYFGHSVALSGDTAIVGAYADDAGGTDSGSAYVFVRNGSTWTEQAKLTASDAAAVDRFGFSVALSGDTAVVGAYSDDHAGGTDAGGAYVFVRTGTAWSEQGKLVASDAVGGEFFGQSVAVSGETALVGAYLSDQGGAADAGSAYVYVRSGTTWSEQAKLVASDAAMEDYFGFSVALSADTAVVGSAYDDHAGGTNAGSAYVFLRSGTTWTEEAKIVASDAATDDWFGDAVALSGDTVLVGAYYADNAGGVDAGSAYVMRLVNKLDLGAACGGDAECSSSFCADGVCCDSACGGSQASDCQACSVAAGAVSDGACAPRAAGTSCRASAGACDVAEVCDGVATGCPADAALPSGTPCGGAPNGDCDAQDVCAGSVGATATCVPTHEPAGTACSDGDACTEGEACDAAGACLAAEAVSCDDGNDCTRDSCDPASGCVHDPAPDGTSCTSGKCSAGDCDTSGQGGAGGADDGGCNVAGAADPGGDALGWLAAALAAVALGRRRRRAA